MEYDKIKQVEILNVVIETFSMGFYIEGAENEINFLPVVKSDFKKRS